MYAQIRDLNVRNTSGSVIVGDPRVGIIAESCSGLLADAAIEYPGQLLRALVTWQSGSVTFAETGAYSTPTPAVRVIWDLYVDGVYIETRQSVLGVQVNYPGKRKHRSGGGIAAVSGSTAAAPVS